ncbi:MAG TPA: hypothetical protein VFN67_01095 [Polyangiales bacterium]|jgi:hypothetical protein|nr:hypothetical protein [Polyangiales bacterium]
MSRERQPPPPPVSGPEHDPSCRFYVEPARFVEGTDADGQPTIEIVEGSFEQSYRVGDTHSTKLFLTLCRSRGLLPYRHRRQHAGTICVRATLTDHNALWAQFLELSRELDARLHEVTSAFLKSVETTSKR